MATQQDIDLRINAAVQLGNSAENLGELRKAMKELNFLATQYGETMPEASSKASAELGKLKDKIADAAASTKSLSGKGLENISGSINLVKGSLSGLDFGSATQGIKNLNTSLKGLKFKELGSELVSFGKELLTLGLQIVKNPIFLLASVILLIITNFEKLKEMGGLVGKVMKGIGDIISSIIDWVTKLTDAIGLTDIANQKKAKNVVANFEKENEAVKNRYEKEILYATAANKNTTYLQLKEQQELEKTAKKHIEFLDARKSKIGELNEDEKKAYEANKKIIEDAGLQQIKVIIDFKKQLDSVSDSLSSKHQSLRSQLYRLQGKETLAIIEETKSAIEEQNKYLKDASPENLKLLDDTIKQIKSNIDISKVSLNYVNSTITEIDKVLSDTKLNKEAKIPFQEKKIELLKQQVDIENALIDNQEKLNLTTETKTQAISNANQAEGNIILIKQIGILQKRKQIIEDTKKEIDKEVEWFLEKGNEPMDPNFSEKTLQDQIDAKSNQLDQIDTLELKHGSATLTTIQDRYDAEIELLQAKQDKELSVINLTEIQRDNIKDYYINKQYEAQVKKEKALTALHKDEWSKRLEYTQIFQSNMNSFFQAISEYETNAAAGSEEQMKKAKKREFNRNKNLGIVNAVINTAVGISKAQELLPPVSYIVSGLIAAVGAAQIAAISRQTYNEDGAGGDRGAALQGGYNPAPAFAGPSVFQTGYTNQIASGGPNFMRVYVLERDITGAQQAYNTRAKVANLFH